jgi:hypothetical protein
MGIAQSVDIALGTVDWGRGDFEERDAFGHGQVSGAPIEDVRIPSVIDKWRQPANLQFRSAVEKEIGTVQDADEAGARIHEMGILGSSGERGTLHVLAADDFGESGKVG